MEIHAEISTALLEKLNWDSKYEILMKIPHILHK